MLWGLENMNKIETLVREFCRENDIEVTLSYNMPVGYETAYGTYDVTINTLFLNPSVLQDTPRYEALFYLYHELRHAVQYLCPWRFDERIRESLPYAILYNGICYKLIGNEWQKCVLSGEEHDFTRAYLALPYEIDANTFAYEKTSEICGDSAELKALFDFWLPKSSFDYAQHRKLFRRIDIELEQRMKKGTKS